LPHCKAFFKELFSGGAARAVEITMVFKGGQNIAVEGHVNVKFKDGKPVSSRAIFRDITERKLAEALLRKEKAFSRELISHSAVATFVIDAEHKVLIWNRACEEMTGFSASEMENTGDHWKAFYARKRPCLADLVIDGNPEDELSAYYSGHRQSRLVPDGLCAEGWYDNLGGKRRYILFEAAPIFDPSGKPAAAIETLQDQTEQKTFEEKLKIAATTDQLTGIHNRRRFEELLEHEIRRSARTREPLSLIMFDIDHFKKVNDTQGHLSGDQVLRSIAQKVRLNIRKTDHLARWGGEEFILMTAGSDMDNSTALAEKLRRVIEGCDFGTAGKVTCSFGVAQLAAGDTVETLTARTDRALYAAKKSGRNRVETARF
ncbi:MAG: diguanylate cyclase, partial [Nitrospiraceae bacterium]|nr:diguanylate cyclase [Nitrospiraceae bacterium]